MAGESSMVKKICKCVFLLRHYIRVYPNTHTHSPGCWGELPTLERQKHYRVSRPDAYGQNTLGYSDPSARQGYYIDACCSRAAAIGVQKREPLRISATEALDVQVWE